MKVYTVDKTEGEDVESLPLIDDFEGEWCHFILRKYPSDIYPYILYLIDHRDNRTFFFDFQEEPSEEWLELHFRSMHCSRYFSRLPIRTL